MKRFFAVLVVLGLFAVCGWPWSGSVASASAEEYVGIGVSLVDMSGPGLDKGKPVGEDVFMVMVGDVFPGGPAEVAGVKSADYIHAVDGKFVRDMRKLEDVVAAIRGSSALTVVLTIHRYPGAAYWEKGEVIELTIEKKTVSHEEPKEE